MTDNKFIIDSISVYNYTGTNEKVNGTVKIRNGSTKTEITMPLTPEDCADIIAVFANRIGIHMGIVAAAVIEELKPQPVIAAPPQQQPVVDMSDDDEPTTSEKPVINDDEYPF